MSKLKRFISVVLTVIIFCSVFSASTTVLATEYNEYIENQEYQQKLLTETTQTNNGEKAEIVCEVPEKRDEFSKTYKRADGSYTSVISQTPLHTYKNGEWEEIDNQLKADGEVIKNVDGTFEIQFPETISENKKITVKNSGESIAFSVNNIDSSSAVVTTPEVNGEDIIEEDLSKTVSEITYESVDENTDVQYVVSSGFVKENIIVNDKSSLKDTYSFDIEKGNLTAVLDDSNNLTLKNDKKETVFTIPAPVMTDANNAVSYDIDVTVENVDKSVLTLIYTPSKEWLTGNDRVFPVVIDPVIALPSENDVIIEDTLIYYTYDDLDSLNTNYVNSPFGVIADVGSVEDEEFVKGNVLVKFNMDVFKGFKSPEIAVTDVNYMGSGNVMGGNILAKPINGTWDSTTITYDDVYPSDGSDPVITYEDKIIDYFTGIPLNTEAEEGSTVYLNITELFNQWLKGERENNGFALVPENSNIYGGIIMGGYIEVTNNSTTKRAYLDSYCTIDYVDTTGTNDSFEYLTQEIGRAGTVNVNTFTRALSLSRSDLSMDSLRLPTGVSFNYNLAINSFIDIFLGMSNDLNEENETIIMPYGNNWIPSYIQFLTMFIEGEYQLFTGEGTLVTFNQKEESVTETVDEVETTKTVITFEEDETSDSGYTLELIDETGDVTFENMKLTSPSGEVSYFSEDGFVNRICEAEPDSDGTYDTINIVSIDDSGFVIDYITDGAGRIYDFVYNEDTGLLTEITCLTADGTQIKAGTTDADLKITYTYDENRNLTGVTYPDGKTVTYTYDSNGNLIKAQNIDNYNIQYTYDSLGKVTGIAEYANTTAGNNITLTEQSNRQVKVTDAFSGTETYQFGKDGRLNYTFDDKGNYIKSEYAVANDESVYEFNDWKIVSENLLKNGSFEDVSALSSTRAKYWSNAFERVTNESAHNGDYVYCISSESAITEFLEQRVAVNNISPYTLSAYVKSSMPESTQGKLHLKIIAKNSSGDTLTQIQSIETAEDWTRVSLTFNPVTQNGTFAVSEITACIGFENSCGTYYVDAVQLETSKGTAEYNLLENASFNNIISGSPAKWSEATVAEKNIYGKNVNAVKLEGGLPYYTAETDNTYTLNDNISSVTQNVKINGKKGAVYSVGGWFKGLFDDNYITPNFMPEYATINTQLTKSSAQIKVTYSYTETVTVTDETTNETTTEEQTVTENFAVDFTPHVNDWQYAIDSFALKGDVESVDVTVIAKNIPADSFATGIELTLNDSAVSFEFDEETNDTTTSPDTSTNTETPVQCSCENCEEYDCACRCETEELCECIQCKRSSNIEVISDDEKTVTTKSYDGANYMQSTVEYSDDKNRIISETDTNGIPSEYTYNENGIVTSVTDGNSKVTSYATNAMGYLTLAETNVTGLTDNAVKMAINYIYDGDLLEKIIQGNVEYDYAYDEWGQLKSVLVDNIRLIHYTYGVSEKRTRITKIVFGSSSENGFTIEYSYDGATGDVDYIEKYNYVEGEKNSIKYEYIYDNFGTLTAIKDNGTGHYISYTDTGVIIKDGENGDTIYKFKDVTPVEDDTEETTDSTDSAETKENEPVSITEETANGVKYTHNVYESNYDAVTGKTTEIEAVVGGKTIGTQSVSDWFGRNEAVTVMTKNPIDDTVTDYASVSSQYGYVTENNVTSNLILSVNNTVTGSEGTNTVNYSYTYDGNGKITGITAVSNITGLSSASQYIYDEAGQLVKEINGADYTEYAYDSKGNISTRKVYSNNTLVSTDNYTYGSETWEDRLTGYNNKTITYDDIGNPTSYLGATLTWRGRELESYTKGNIQISFSYDVDGMRYQKVVKTNGVETSRYDYVYSEGSLILITFTADNVSDTARFIYDSYGEPRGFILNNTAAYLYLKNAQGDITGIVNENGEIILTCSYDAWGRVNFGSTDMAHMTLAAKLSQINPFTYRGYCYDYDIGMYYLQSRYYDPEICRFINVDSTDYLGATGTLLSYNLFAYCENDGVNGVDPLGYYTYKSFSTSSSNNQIKSYAKALFDAKNYPYFKINYTTFYSLYNGKSQKYKRPSHTYNTTHHYYKKKMVQIIYTPYMNPKGRVVGTFLYKTVVEWKLYIQSRHMTLFTRFKQWILRNIGMSEDDYSFYLDALSDASVSSPIENIVLIYSFVDMVMDLISDYRDDLDDYILKCISNRGNNVYIMISWSLQYQTWRMTNKGFQWCRTSMKSIHDYY